MSARMWTDDGKPIPFPNPTVDYPHRYLRLRADKPVCLLCDRDLLDPIHLGPYLGPDPDEYDIDGEWAARNADQNDGR